MRQSYEGDAVLIRRFNKNVGIEGIYCKYVTDLYGRTQCLFFLDLSCMNMNLPPEVNQYLPAKLPERNGIGCTWLNQDLSINGLDLL